MPPPKPMVTEEPVPVRFHGVVLDGAGARDRQRPGNCKCRRRAIRQYYSRTVQPLNLAVPPTLSTPPPYPAVLLAMTPPIITRASIIEDGPTGGAATTAHVKVPIAYASAWGVGDVAAEVAVDDRQCAEVDHGTADIGTVARDGGAADGDLPARVPEGASIVGRVEG